MDPAMIIGLALAFGSLLAMIFLEGASVTSLLIPAPMILVFGATIAVAIASSTIRDSILAVKTLPHAFRGKLPSNDALIEQLVHLAEVARREGLLALEREAESVDDPFLKRALQQVADGTDAEELRDSLEDELDTRDRKNRTAAKFFSVMGGYAPTIGIIGTVVSLTHVLEYLESPETLGPAIATAFVATLWGLLSANFIWLPIGTRLSRLADLEVDQLSLVLEGVMAVQAGAQPRLLAEKLRAMAPDRSSAAPAKQSSLQEAA
ncbi:motility protein A [Ruicaihuangia caeni]|uniref:motility protein A n=1 Tax=Ruicaihuangia caeni TaxID=3042517 RepID=UPI00338E1392